MAISLAQDHGNIQDMPRKGGNTMSEATPDDLYAHPTEDGKYAVGGIKLDRPFKIVRLGHFGFNSDHIEETVSFYTDILGFEISDVLDASKRLTDEQKKKVKGPPIGVFTRYGSDHHAMVLFNRSLREISDPPGRWPEGVTTNQITWQCGSLAQISDAVKWFESKQVPIVRSGRDMPGSNWHTYVSDPNGNVNELYYGIEQIGWDGHSKPLPMHDRIFKEAPSLPQISEYQEVCDALTAGVDPTSGYRNTARPDETYSVDGILMARPFKVTHMGPVRLFQDDVADGIRFYTETLGFTLTEEVEYKGHKCAFLRANTEHHAVALYPMALREPLGMSPHTSNFSIGMQVSNYRQLRDARSFLMDKGYEVFELPAELFPGIDYTFFVRDPDGHAVQFYYYVEQVGWDGKPRPADQRRKVTMGEWPDSLDAMSDSFMGEPFLGPLA
jgi:catechol 2,3-dioxygenase-like lactoylglutathione lyase family enzyme